MSVILLTYRLSRRVVSICKHNTAICCSNRPTTTFKHHGWRHLFLGNFKSVGNDRRSSGKYQFTVRKPALKIFKTASSGAKMQIFLLPSPCELVQIQPITGRDCTWHVQARLGRGGLGPPGSSTQSSTRSPGQEQMMSHCTKQTRLNTAHSAKRKKTWARYFGWNGPTSVHHNLNRSVENIQYTNWHLPIPLSKANNKTILRGWTRPVINSPEFSTDNPGVVQIHL